MQRTILFLADKWYNDQLYKVAPAQMEIMAIGTDWKQERRVLLPAHPFGGRHRG